ncbi:cysteine hydrolase family protein [Nisaea denitrificans]|uniref:cysteine hydrolase family protein n=1 Tax=Nisaea denitrificans TaxID=390877 RepID=UPI00041392E5|nr:cysteine hydrolase family protein [Nisaea denitrificans]
MSDTPKTLLQMAGVPNTPPALGESVLLVIDAQNEYVSGVLALPGAAPATDVLASVLAKARAAGAPVVHVRHKGNPGGAFDPETDRFAIIDAVSPQDGEEIVDKKLPNSFAGTNLQAVLEATGRKKLIIGGFMTHMCVSSTTRAALDLGWSSAVISDGCATRALPSPTGGKVVDADTLHEASLAGLSDRFAIIAPGSAF